MLSVPRLLAGAVVVAALAAALPLRAAKAEVVITVRQDGAGMYTTLAEAFAAVPVEMVEAHTIVVEDSGVYEESLHISSRPTSEELPLVLRAADGERPTIKGTSSNYTLAISSSWVVVEGFRVEGGYRRNGVSVGNVEQVELRRLEIFGGADTASGIWVDDGRQLLIEGCEIHHNVAGVGLYDRSVRYVTLRNNIIRDNERWGLRVYRDGGDHLIVHNTIYGNGGRPLYFGDSRSGYEPGARSRVHNNVLVGLGPAIRIQKAANDGLLLPGMVIDFNAVHVVDGGPYAQIDELSFWDRAGFEAATGQGTHDVVGDPAFVEPEPAGDRATDLRPRSVALGYALDSPVIETGLETWSAEADFAGLPRPEGRWPDPGAHEQAATSFAPNLPVAFEFWDVQDPLALGSGFNATVVAVNSSGLVAEGYRGKVLLSSSDERAVISESVTFTEADAGRHRLRGDVLLLSEGEHWVRVEDAEDPAISGERRHLTVRSRPTFKCVVRQDGRADSEEIGGCVELLPETLTMPSIVEIADSGSYHETVSLAAVASEQNPLVLRRREGSMPVVTAATRYQSAVRLLGGGATVESLSIRGVYETHGVEITSHANTVQSCVIQQAYRNNYAGVRITGGADNQVRYNLLTGNNWGVIVSGAGAARNSVVHNLIVEQGKGGIWIYGGANENVVRHNTLFENGTELLIGHGSRWQDIGKGNIWLENIASTRAGGIAIRFASYKSSAKIPEGTVSDANDLFAAGEEAVVGRFEAESFGTLAEWQEATALDASSISADPLFAEPGIDFHLKSEGGRFKGGEWVSDDVTSPCIDAALAETEVWGEPEPNGGRANIGYYGQSPEASRTPAVDGGGAP